MKLLSLLFIKTATTVAKAATLFGFKQTATLLVRQRITASSFSGRQRQTVAFFPHCHHYSCNHPRSGLQQKARDKQAPQVQRQFRCHSNSLSSSNNNYKMNTDSSSTAQQAVPWPWKNHHQQILPQCILPLGHDSYKGSSGRIAIIGGSDLYTGAPYYAATAALQTGADLVTIFTAAEAAVPLKSYSPELMVQAVYQAQVWNDVVNKQWTIDDINDELLAQYSEVQRQVQQMVDTVTENIHRYHCLIVGPGLGKCPLVGHATGHILKFVRQRCPTMPVVLDADALWCLNTSRELWQEAVVQDSAQIILTPNRMEYQRFLGHNNSNNNESEADWGRAATIIQKGREDCIRVGFHHDQENDENSVQTPPILVVEPGGMKRSGGIGDVLAGTTGTVAAWQYILQQKEKAQTCSSWTPAAWTACHLVKRATHVAWRDKKRAMTAPDILDRLGAVFDEMIGQEYHS